MVESAVLGCAVSVLVGGLVLALAIWQMRSGSVRFLHSYHYSTVPAAELPALARESGRWLAATGISVILLGPTLLLPAPYQEIATAILVTVLLASTALACRAIVKYNGSLFG